MGVTVIRFKKTITKYVLSEMTGPYLLGLLIFTFVLLMERVLELIELVINKGVSLEAVMEMILYIMPSFLVLTIPMAVLVATLTAFGRLSTDSEVTAMKASGISLYSLFTPVLYFAIAAALITFLLYTIALPWGNYNFRKLFYELARTKASVGLKDKVFNSTFRGLVIYIDEIVGSNSFKSVMISDSRDQKNPQTIFANQGKLITDENAMRVILRLYDGASHAKYIVTGQKYQIVEFPKLDILLSLQDEDKQQIDIPRTDREMRISELIQAYSTSKHQETPPQSPTNATLPSTENSLLSKLTRYGWIGFQLCWDSFFFQKRLSSGYLVEIHKRFSIPLACLIFGLIGTPLGIQSRRAGKSGGYAISIVLLLIYYIFITAGEGLGDDGKIPVFWAVWTPNIFLGVAGTVLLTRIARR